MRPVSKSPALLAGVAILAMSCLNRAWAQTLAFDIPAEDANKSIPEFARQAGVQIVAPGDQLKGVKTTALKGSFDTRRALGRLLAGTGMSIVSDDGQTIVLKAAAKSGRTTWNEGEPVDNSAMQDVIVATEQVVVTGQRGSDRTVLDSPVPVDVIPNSAMQQTSFPDIDNVLNDLVPSFQVSRDANTNTGSFIRPISLRGLPQDELLLLLNSKRRHLSASVGSSGYGAQGPDPSVIPIYALKTVEVLRDGAASLYGSDAIAGVINLILKDNDDGFSLMGQVGQTAYGDGQIATIAANVGMKIPFLDKGFISATAQYDRQGATVRSAPYIKSPLYSSSTFDCPSYAQANPVFAGLIGYDNGNNPKACILNKYGQPSGNDIRTTINSGLPVTDHSELYYFGNFSLSKYTLFSLYRYPANNQATNGVNIRQADGSVWNFTEEFPAGFGPLSSGQITDWSSVGGYRGNIPLDGGQNITYDFSVRYGRDSEARTLTNTVNPSYGPASPTTFHPFTNVASEWSYDADFSYTFPFSWVASPPVLSAGLESRHQGYMIEPGDLASYNAGPYATPDPYGFCNDAAHTPTAKGLALPASAGLNCASTSDPVYHVLPVGSQAVAGLPPQSSGNWSDRDNAVYAELTTDLLKGWNVDFSGRYEDYKSVGTNLTGRFATLYQLTDWLGIRGSVGTGFHAPPPGMLNYTRVQIVTVNGAIAQSAVVPASNPVAQFLGAKPETPEKSLNYSAGITATPFEDFTLTTDAYLIKMYDQIYAVSPITVTPTIASAITAAGIAGAASISSVDFFQNAFDSNTYGLDVVSTYQHAWDEPLFGLDQTTYATASWNLNRYVITHLIVPNLFNAASVYNFEHNQVKWKGIVSLTQEFGPYSATLRGNFYGPSAYETTAAPYLFQNVGADMQYDVVLSYKFLDHYKLSFDADNVFNKMPARNLINPGPGSIYYDGPESYQGTYYYFRLVQEF